MFFTVTIIKSHSILSSSDIRAIDMSKESGLQNNSKGSTYLLAGPVTIIFSPGPCKYLLFPIVAIIHTKKKIHLKIHLDCNYLS